MANRFPLIIDSATNRIVELPATDNLDLAGSNISSVANITAGNSVTASYFVGTLYGVANIAVVANSVAGANVSGQVGYAAVANSVAAANITGTITATTAGTVTTNAQPNITSTGSLTGLTVSNASGVVNFITTSNVSLGAVGNVKITGGSANQYLQTDGAGNLTFATLNAASYQLQSVVAATTINIGLSGTQTIDDVAVTAGQRVLVKNQTVGADNGIYVCAAGAWSRASDFTTGAATLLGGVTVGVAAGSNNQSTQWMCSNTGTITIGSTSITFIRNNINRILASTTLATSPAYVNPDVNITNSIAFGNGANAQQSFSTALGGTANAGSYGTAVGYGAKAIGLGSIAIGILANVSTPSRSIAIGENSSSSKDLTVSLGYGTYGNGANAIALATNANANGVSSVAIGSDSKAAGNFSISIGSQAGGSTAGGIGTISIGQSAGYSTQGANSIAIGVSAGEQSQNAYSIAVGFKAGINNQGANSIAIGTNAGFLNQANNTIILNATGSNLNQTTANTFTVKPIRNALGANLLYYDNSTGEITHTNSPFAVTSTDATINGLSVGTKIIPQNSQSTNYTLVADDSGKQIFHPSADTTARTFTIPANSSVAYAVGTTVTFINQSSAGNVSIAITTDTMRLAGNGAVGTRTLTANGVATAIKLTSTEWIISGVNLT